MNWAWNNGELKRTIPFLKLPEGHGREHVLTIAELAQLWNADMPQHVRVFLALAIGTAARPESILQLSRFQCDLDHGTINLNPPGRVQTKKRRPILPMADWLRPWIEAAEGPLVAWRGKPVHKIAGAFQTMRDAAGFGPDVTAYTLRHTIATELTARGVPELEIAALLGHRMPNSRTTGRYVHVAPERLVSARKALDAIAAEVEQVATRPMSPQTSVRASCVLGPTAGVPLTGWRYGAGEGIRTLDPNLGKVNEVKKMQKLKRSNVTKTTTAGVGAPRCCVSPACHLLARSHPHGGRRHCQLNATHDQGMRAPGARTGSDPLDQAALHLPTAILSGSGRISNGVLALLDGWPSGLRQRS